MMNTRRGQGDTYRRAREGAGLEEAEAMVARGGEKTRLVFIFASREQTRALSWVL